MSAAPQDIAVAELRRSARVLSAAGAAHAAEVELRDKLALLDTGTLLMVPGAALDQDVLAYRDRLDRAGVRVVVQTAPLDELRALYEAAGHVSPVRRTAATESARQLQVLNICRAAVKAGASDLHFKTENDGLFTLRQRVHGLLNTIDSKPAADGEALMATIYQSMVSTADATYKPHLSQDARMKRDMAKTAGLYGCRIVTLPLDDGRAMVLRLLHSAGERPRSMADLGYSTQHAPLIKRMTERKTGLNIFSGPTGSGKSTTLEVLLSMLVRHHNGQINGITLEDPPEYHIPGFNQVPVIEDDWDGGIRALMRADPDVIMIGEMRDAVSASAGFRAALTGHGVWSTLHTNDATAILQRLEDIGVDRALLLDPTTLTGLINQGLAPVLCPDCKRSWIAARVDADPGLVERVEARCNPTHVFVRGPGCSRCRSSGIIGRRVIAEVIVPTARLMRAYAVGGKLEARADWIAGGGITKAAHLASVIGEGTVDPRLGEEHVCALDDDDVVTGGRA
jgi:type II secretory ATPase GspE/PulE/Tfp pilus assembly ATPase PilB-like protein